MNNFKRWLNKKLDNRPPRYGFLSELERTSLEVFIISALVIVTLGAISPDLTRVLSAALLVWVILVIIVLLNLGKEK